MKIPKSLNASSLSLGLLVIFAFLASVYYAMIAQDRYASTTVLSVTDTSGSSSGSSSAASLLMASVTPASHGDAYFLYSYIHSMDLLKKLDAQFDLKAHYGSPRFDAVYRLRSDVGSEDFLAYFRARVKLTIDELSGLVTVEVQGFEPAYTQKLTQAIVAESERFINENAHRIARTKMAFAESEVERSLKRVQGARADLVAFQTKHKLMDPTSQSSAASSLMASLQATQAKQEADLKAALTYLSEDSLQVRSLRGQLMATQSQLETERLRATAATQGNQLPTLNVEFQRLLTQASFADEAYKASFVAFEQARIDAARQLKTLVVMEPPTMPDLPQYPHRIIDWLTALAICVMSFTIFRLVAATVREHQD